MIESMIEMAELVYQRRMNRRKSSQVWVLAGMMVSMIEMAEMMLSEKDEQESQVKGDRCEFVKGRWDIVV